MSAEELNSVSETLERVWMPKPVAVYIAGLVAASDPGSERAPDEVRRYVQYGASPRAAIGLAEAARALAQLEGRPSVGFEDVDFVAPYVLNHRILLNYQARYDKVEVFDLVQKLVASVPASGWTGAPGVSVGGGGA